MTHIIAWKWKPEAQVLRDLGFYDTYTGTDINDRPERIASRLERRRVLGSIMDASDPRRMALAALYERLHKDKDTLYGGKHIDELLEYGSPPRIHHDCDEDGKGHRAKQKRMTAGWFAAPELLEYITPDMVKAELDKIELTTTKGVSL